MLGIPDVSVAALVLVFVWNTYAAVASVDSCSAYTTEIFSATAAVLGFHAMMSFIAVPTQKNAMLLFLSTSQSVTGVLLGAVQMGVFLAAEGPESACDSKTLFLVSIMLLTLAALVSGGSAQSLIMGTAEGV